MKIGIVLVTFKSVPEELLRSIRESGLNVEWFVHHHGSSLDLANRINGLFEIQEAKITFHMTNRGLAASWNDGIHDAIESGSDVVVVVNDDIVFFESGFDRFCDFIRINNDSDLYFTHGE